MGEGVRKQAHAKAQSHMCLWQDVVSMRVLSTVCYIGPLTCQLFLTGNSLSFPRGLTFNLKGRPISQYCISLCQGIFVGVMNKPI